jgi:hypothetical protein
MVGGFDESTSWFDRLMRRFKRAGTAVVRIVDNSDDLQQKRREEERREGKEEV